MEVAFMASVSPSPNPAPGSPDNLTKIDAFGVKLEIPLPKWAVASLAVLLIAVALCAAVYYSATKISNSVIMPAPKLAEYEESNFHELEPKQLKVIKEEQVDDMTTVTVNYFKSDGCVQVIRYNNSTAKSDAQWLFGLHPHALHIQKAAYKLTPSHIPDRQLLPESYRLTWDRPHMALRKADFQSVQQGRCLNPHPGSFSVRNEQVNQCIYKVWRIFPDGCVHFQFFDACRNTWDVNPDGTPRLTWTRCIH
jgi:hypothetical protein